MCKQQIYVAALTKSDGSKTRYKTFTDAWSAAIENNGSSLKLLCDVDLGRTGENAALKASSGIFTVDLNRFTLSADSNSGVISVGNTAKLTVKNGKLTNTPTRGDSSITCAVKVFDGYVELENVELTGGSAFGEQNCSAIVYNGTLNITDSTFNGALMVYPDLIGKVEPKITSATLNNGIVYKYEGDSNKNYDGLKGFFADGSMFFDENGKYVDLTSDTYWSTKTVGTSIHTTFKYDKKAVVKPHTHTFFDGVCSECGYACPHNGGIEREAGYFRKAVCSLCHCEYGDYVKDITAPVGEINTKERTWWQTALNKISFGLFYKEDVKAEIIGKDDSYNQPGFDITKHAVKIEYLVSNTVLSEEAVKTSSFTEYTEEIDLSDDNRYVIYAKLTDHAGNVTYAGSDGFEIDKTAPVIEGMVNGGQYKFCIEKTVTVTEKNTDKVTLDGAEITLDENGGFSLPVDSKEHTVFVADKAGNQTTVYVTVYSSHSFDAATESCKQCGTHAVAKAENGDITESFSNGDELFEALNDQKYSGAAVTLLEDVTLTKSVNLQNNLTVNLNGKTLRKKGSVEITVNSGNVMFCSQKGEGIITVPLTVDGSDARLIMGSGLGNVSNVRRTAGKLTVYSGNYSMFSSYADSEAEDITLYGGKYLSISLKSALCRDILAKGYRYKGYSYEQAAVGSFPDVVVVIPCDHADTVDNTCSGCGMEFFLSVEVNGVEKIFDTFESAVRYAEQNEGCTVKLLQDLTLDKTSAGSLLYGYHIDLRSGKYTLDLVGQILDVDGNYLVVDDDCNLTVCDSVGGGMLADSKGTGLFKVRNVGKLTITGGDFTDINIQACARNALTLKGGSFKEINSVYSANCSPFAHLADGYAFALSDGSRYANEGDVKINNDQVIRNVTVVSAPVVIPTLGQPNDTTFYLTSPNNMKYAGLSASYAGGKTDKNITVTLEKTDGTVIGTEEVPAAASIVKSFDLTGFTAENSGQYRVKLEFNGYVLYSNTFTVTVMACEHPGYDEDTHKCTQCGCDLAAAVINGEKTTGYISFAEALTAAQSNENKNCTLKLLSDVSGTVAVKSGTFTIDAANVVIDGKLNVSKGADLTVNGGVVTGNVICAKGGKLNASKTYFSGAVNCVGDGDFTNCQFIGTVSGKGGLKLYSCEIIGDISVSGKAEWQMCIVGGAVTVNNGGSLKSSGDTYRKAIKAKSGGTLEIISGICNGVVTAESGSKFISASGSFSDVAVENGVDFTLAGGNFTKITVDGKHLIDCLKDGTAFEDTNTGDVIDGRVSIAGHVKVVSHTHSCVWNTKTHEKLCGCGYVETTDTKAPVISGIENGKTYYGATEFSVTDDNDFTVTIDGNPVKLTIGSYILVPDNKSHTITAADAAGNTASVTVSTFMLYKVTLGSGNGYTVTGEPVAGYGTDYTFTVEIADGYSKTDNFMVDVNGMPLTSDNGSYTYPSVESDIYVTVFGVADITPPDAEVSVGTNKFKSFINNVSFGLFFKKSQTVFVTASDLGSGIDKMEYLLSDTAFTDKAAVSGDWTELTLTDGKASFSIEPNKKAYIYVRVTDVSGNVQIINTDGVVVYTDSQAITESVSFTMLEKNDVSFNVKLNGNTVSALYNGTALIGKDNYTVTEDGTVTLKNGYLSSLAAGEYTVRVAYNPMGESYKSGDEPNVTALKLTVNKAEPILDISDVVCQKEYDGQPIETPSYTTSSDGAVTVEYKPWGADDSAYGTTAPKNGGKYEFRISVAESDTYKPTSAVGVCEILVKEVSIVGTAVKATKIYDGTDKAEITNMGSLSDNYDGKNLSIVVGEAAYSDKNVGEGKNVNFSGFALTGSAAANYKLVKQPASVIADITAKEITINGTTVEPSKVYDGTTAAEITNAGTLSDNYDGENLAIVTGSASYDNKNAGENKTVTFGEFSLTGSAAANYKLIKQPASVTADITVKEITINGTAVKPSKVYDGTTAAEITAVGAPSVNYDGDNLTVSVGKAEYDNKNAGTGKTVVFSGFSLSGSEASNYKLSAQPESVTADIAAKKITITGTSVKDSKVYDGNTDAEITSVGTIEGLIKGDKLTVKKGSAAYSDRNAGIGKTVTFSGFSVSGSAAANYELASQPESTFASIGAKELTVIDLKVKDKQYDGTNTAEIDGTPKLSGLVDGDSVQLLNGIPTFDDVNVGKNIPVSFTSFSLFGDSTMLCNYKLIQPSGITASITRYVADGSEYRVNSNDWINTDFVITANEGWLLSRTDTADGDWSNELTASDETKDGKLIFYVKNIKTGAISSAVTEKYHIDKTLPTGEIKLNGRSAFQTVLNKISFGLFFKDDVNVGVTAKDDSSGVKSVMYYESGSVLSEDEVLAITDWTEKSDFDIEASDNDKFVVYVRIEDNAGNVRFIGSDGAIFDTESPKIVGVENGKTYYVTKKVAVDDENLESVTLNGTPASEVFTLGGDTDATYNICAKDKAGNVTEYTVFMKPISSVTDAVSGITKDNVKSSDADTVLAVERLIFDIAESFDDGVSTDAEWNKLTKASAKCKELSKRIADVADEIARLTDGVNSYDINTVTSDDKTDIEKLIADIDVLLGGDNLTPAERDSLEALKALAKSLSERIEAAKSAAESPEITAVKGITKDNAKLEDKNALTKAKKAIEDALKTFGNNYTEEERKELEKQLDTVNEALEAIGNAEKVKDEIDKLPSPDNITPDDKDAVDRVREAADNLSEEEKAILGKEELSKIDALYLRISELEKQAAAADDTLPTSPRTGETDNIAMWMALLFVSGGLLTGMAVSDEKKKKHSEK